MDPESQFLQRAGVRVRVVGRNCQELLPLLTKYPVEILSEDSAAVPELVISSGGDGALLGAERDYPGIPKCPIRDRSHNPKCPQHSEEQLLDALFSGQLPGRHLARICATTRTGEQLVGLNDIVTTRMVQQCAVRYRISVNGELLRPQIVADSLVACTAFGSTGYFMSITRGSFQQGIGLAFNNPQDGESFIILPEDAVIEVEMLRGPAAVMADNNPCLLQLADGERVTLALTPERTLVFGLEALRCPACYQLRRNGVN